jgi:hypothetical protein
VDDVIQQNGTVTDFSGVYNGDHWQITLLPGSNRSVFSNISGTVKKLRLAGELQNSRSGNVGAEDSGLGSLAKNLKGGTISEVGSTVTIKSSLTGSGAAAEIGGLIGVSENGDSANDLALIQYSFYSGKIELAITPNVGVSGASVGGLVGRGEGSLRIRDSYGRAQMEYVKPQNMTVRVGGVIGWFLGTQLNVIRTYAAGSFTVTDQCQPTCPNDTTFFGDGGLVGEANDMGLVRFVSSFWLAPTPSVAVGRINRVGDVPPLMYSNEATVAPVGAPVAVMLNAQTLRAITTFQSKGSGSTPFGASTGDNSLPVGASQSADATPVPIPVNDYRWAIEAGNVEGFVAQKRVASPTLVGESVTFTRAFDRLLWANSSVPPATYTTRGVSETVTGYPTLGRVWEICAEENNGFPVLVWEERNCAGEGTGGGGADRNRDKPADTELAAALAAGLSGAELQAFLASGLTLEQWLAQRLAATGTPGEALGLGVLIAGVLTMVGLGLIVARRRFTWGGAR